MIDIKNIILENPHADNFKFLIDITEDGSTQEFDWEELLNVSAFFHLPHGDFDYNNGSGDFIFNLNYEKEPIRLYCWEITDNEIVIEEKLRIEANDYMKLYEKLLAKDNFSDFSHVISVVSLSELFKPFWIEQGFNIYNEESRELGYSSYCQLVYLAKFKGKKYEIIFPQIDGDCGFYGLNDSYPEELIEIFSDAWDDFWCAKNENDWTKYSLIEEIE